MNTLHDIAACIRKGEHFLLTTHANPDGDAIGSMLALNHLLNKMEKKTVVCVNHDPVPSLMTWLPGAEGVLNPSQAQQCMAGKPLDYIIILDVAQRERLGDSACLLPEASANPGNPVVLVIDHHATPVPCGDINCIDTSYAAVGEMVVELFGLLEVPLFLEAAQCAYVSQITDTNGYRYKNTNARSHRLASLMLETGLEPDVIAVKMFDTLTRAKFDLQQRVLKKTEFSEDGRLTWTEVSCVDMTETGASLGDLDGLLNLARNVEGVVVAVLFREMNATTTKISMRSKGAFHCARTLAHWGGGGHPGAGGATLELPLTAAKAEVLARLNTLLKEEA